MEECLFCRIVRQEIGSEIVAENSNAIAIRDINPQAPVHILVIPREHIATLKDITPEKCDVITDMFMLINELTVSEGIVQRGFRIVINQGEDGGQEVGHLHFHLLGGRFMRWPPG